MPVTSSAQKALRRDRRRNLINQRTRLHYRTALKTARQKPSPQTLKSAFSALDKAAKTHIIHKNKAARLKSRLAKLISSPKPKTNKKPTSKTSSRRQSSS